MDPTQQTLRSAVCLFDELFETHLWHIFEGSCLKYKHFGTLPDVLHGVQLRSKRLKWYGHVCKIWNDIVLSDFHKLNIRRPFRDAQNKPAWQD